MKRLGRTLPFLVAALLTFQGLAAMAAQPATTSTGGGQPAATTPNRDSLVREILGLWENAPNPVDSENRLLHGDLRAALKLATVDQLVDARQARTYEDLVAALPKRAQGQTGPVPIAAAQLVPLALDPATSDLVYTPVTPCRIIDTRGGVAPYTGVIGPNSGNSFYVTGTDYSNQGGFAGSCGIPTSPKPAAVAINVTSTGQAGTGNLRAIQTGVGTPLVSLVNYVAGVNIANAAIVPTYQGSGPELWIYSGNSTSQAVVDIMGYFNSPAATALDTVTVENSLSCATGGTDCTVTSVCPAGYVVTGGGFQSGLFTSGMDFVFNSIFGNGWRVEAQNNTAFGQYIYVDAVCARVPGH